jgi:starvation-inducible DNA-binding protein
MNNLEQNLNELLSDLNIFFRKLQNYHWNIEGMDFFIIHEKLEEYYNEVNMSIDEIAEHILILGGQPLGTMEDYLNTGTIVEAKNEKIKSEAILHNLINDFGMLLKKVIQIKEEADKQNQYGTSSLMDEYILGYEKKIWMLKQTTNKHNS